MTWQVHTGDCLEFLRTLPSGSVDAVVTDPPYGISYADHGKKGSLFPTEKIIGDDKPFDPHHLLGVSELAVIWGGNNFAHLLPRGGWLCWDKRLTEDADRIIGSPFEMAWCSNPKKFKMARIQHGGVVNADGPFRRVHPTQKPIELMRWCMDVMGVPEGATVLDPYCGSGTTGVACIQTGRNFIGCEIDPKYADIARRRISDAAPLFNQKPDAVKDEVLFGEEH